jgi:hypothetical protein
MSLNPVVEELAERLDEYELVHQIESSIKRLTSPLTDQDACQTLVSSAFHDLEGRMASQRRHRDS